MKKFGSTLLLFVPFAISLYILFVFLSGSYLPDSMHSNLVYNVGSAGHSFSRFQELKEQKNIDLLFIGSSHAYRGFDPRLFPDFQTFNIGSSSQTPIQSEMLIKRHVKKLNPKWVIYEVYPLTFSMDGVESAVDLIANDKNDFQSFRMAIKTNKIKVYNTLIFGFLNDMLHVNSNHKEAIKKYNDTYISGGYVERKLAFYKAEKVPTKRKYEFNEAQFCAFNASLAYLRDMGIKVILVQTPIVESEYESYSNNSKFDLLMRSTKLPYYNFNKLMHLDDSLHFYDKSHLNQNGVQIFNKKLREVIKSNDLLK
ncbi:MAG: hypothetical protein V4638_00410 [Bacteroidota bacterium]